MSVNQLWVTSCLRSVHDIMSIMRKRPNHMESVLQNCCCSASGLIQLNAVEYCHRYGEAGEVNLYIAVFPARTVLGPLAEVEVRSATDVDLPAAPRGGGVETLIVFTCCCCCCWGDVATVDSLARAISEVALLSRVSGLLARPEEGDPGGTGGIGNGEVGIVMTTVEGADGDDGPEEGAANPPAER